KLSDYKLISKCLKYLLKFDEALSYLIHAYETIKSESTLLYDICDLLKKLGRYDEALLYYDHIHIINKSTDIINEKGKCCVIMERYDDALQYILTYTDLTKDYNATEDIIKCLIS